MVAEPRHAQRSNLFQELPRRMRRVQQRVCSLPQIDAGEFDWTTRRIHPCQKHLIETDHFFEGIVLSNYFATEGCFEVTSVITAFAGI